MFVECVCSDDLLTERLRKRETLYSISDARLKHFEQIRKNFEPLNELCDDMHVIIYTGNTPEESIREILSQDYFLLTKQTQKAMER